MSLKQYLVETMECPGDQRDRVTYDNGKSGLAVRVFPGGSKSYIYDHYEQHEYPPRPRRFHLGNANSMSLEEARDAAEDIRIDHI